MSRPHEVSDQCSMPVCDLMRTGYLTSAGVWQDEQTARGFLYDNLLLAAGNF
jgi:hypothetical protein